MNPRIALVTPLKDEEKFIRGMIESILDQQIRPEVWVIVDDGSTDNTPDIVQDYCGRFPFIELLRLPARSERKPGGEGAIVVALAKINPADFDYIARFDADLLFEPDYFARILQEFDRDPALGIAGGCLYVEKNGRRIAEKAPEYHVRGAVKMYRRACFAELGGLGTEIGWDTTDEVWAWTSGWKTRSFADISVIHRRPTGVGIRAARIYRERGRAEYLTWSHPVFIVLKVLKIAIQNPLNAWSFALGVSTAYIRKDPRPTSAAFRHARRSQQLSRLLSACLPRMLRSRMSTQTIIPSRNSLHM
ncbi:glycosyltransferase [Silvibacterium acidisoli]|uniref:glycosyltransferase n=1 Tax=Acidobacteriaceae bacterium ZG23-2 TaxID=2883246 RepID=UPI00406C7B66